jgi:UDP-glucose 4-epimerase
MKVLVTGASGFVGARACTHLEAAGHDVVRLSHSDKAGFDSTFDYFVDIADAETFSNLDDVNEIDAIVHCAGIAHRFGRTSKEDYWRVNVEGTTNVAEFAAQKKVGRFVHLSSVLVYGPSRSAQPVTAQQTPAPADDYSSSKLAGEAAATAVCMAAGIKLAILRPVPVLGEGSRGNVARLIRAIDRNRFVWIGDGRNERSFVYVSDVAEAVLTALSIPEEFAIFNVTGGSMTVRELVEGILEKLGRRSPVRIIPHSLAAFALATSRPVAGVARLGTYHRTLETWLADAVYSGEAFASKGFHTATDLQEALRREVDFYLASK